MRSYQLETDYEFERAQAANIERMLDSARDRVAELETTLDAQRREIAALRADPRGAGIVGGQSIPSQSLSRILEQMLATTLDEVWVLRHAAQLSSVG